VRTQLLRAAARAVVITGLLAVPATPASATVPVADRQMVPLQIAPGTTRVYANAINSTGDVVGEVDGRAVAWDPAGRLRYLRLPGGYERSYAYAINDSGVIVGSIVDENGEPDREYAARWNTNGTVDRLAPDEERGTRATAINSHGVIAGIRTIPLGPPSPVRFRGGGVVELGQRRGTITGIADDAGATVTGYYIPYMCDDCVQSGFQHRIGGGSGNHILSPSPAEASTAADITASGTWIAGTVAGQATLWNLRAFPPPLGSMWWRHTLGQVEPGAETRVAAMSRSGEFMVGTAKLNNVSRAFIRENGAFSYLPGVQSWAIDVNDSGVVLAKLQLPDSDKFTPVLWR